MKTFPTTFTTEKNRKTGAKPVWILMLTVNKVDYFIANRVINVPAFTASSFWPSGLAVTTKMWAKSWGNLQEGISNSLAEFNISNYTFEAIIDPDASPNIETLCTQYDIEESPVRLFLWFEGCADAPQLMFSGFVKDVSIPSNTSVILTIQDDSVKLERTYIGTKLDTATYPLADPDDIGKIIPIPFGTVEKVRALCVDSGWVSSILAEIGPGNASFAVTQLPAYSLVGKNITIDDEQMTVTAQSSSPPYENRALSGIGTTISATSTASGSADTSAIDGNHLTPNGTGSFWKSAAGATPGSPQTLEITFPVPMLVDRFDVFFPQDNLASTTEPVLNTTTGTTYVTPDWTIWLYIGYWLQVGTAVGNNKIWRQWTALQHVATKAKIVFTSNCPGGYATCAEIEVWGRPETYTGDKWLSVTRGVASTVAINHTKGSTVIEKKTTPLVYLCSDRPLTSIGNIYARIRGVLVDITSDCTKYTNVVAGDFGGLYVGKAAVSIPDFAKVSQRISLTLAGDVTATDPGHSHNTGGAANSNATQSANSGTSNTLSTQVYSWSATNNKNRFPAVQEFVAAMITFPAVAGTILSCNMTLTVAGYTPSTGGHWYLLCNSKRITPIYPSFNVSPTITHDATSMQGNTVFLVVGAYPTGQDASLIASCGGCIISGSRTITYNNSATVTVVPAPAQVTVQNTLELSGNSVADIMIGEAILVDMVRTMADSAAALADIVDAAKAGRDSNMVLESEFRNGLADLLFSNGASATALSGYAGAIQITPGAAAVYAYKGNFAFTVGETYCLSVVVKMNDLSVPRQSDGGPGGATVDVVGVINNSTICAAAGVVALGGNLYRCSWVQTIASVGAFTNSGVLQNTTNSGKGFVVTAFQINPGWSPDVYKPTTTAVVTNKATVKLTGTLPASYALNGAITETDTALRILNKLAMQLRCFFKFSGGYANLIYRTGTPASVKTISACKAVGGRLMLSRQKTATSEIINKIDVQYLLDYSKSRGPTAYRAVSSFEWTPSQDVNGIHENPNLFFFDFVNSSTHADDLKFFYLIAYCNRHWLFTFEVFLDNCEIEFADYVTLGFVSGSPVGQVIRAEYYPGDISKTHTVRLTVLV